MTPVAGPGNPKSSEGLIVLCDALHLLPADNEGGSHGHAVA